MRFLRRCSSGSCHRFTGEVYAEVVNIGFGIQALRRLQTLVASKRQTL
jgi:hypothetical protein